MEASPAPLTLTLLISLCDGKPVGVVTKRYLIFRDLSFQSMTRITYVQSALYVQTLTEILNFVVVLFQVNSKGVFLYIGLAFRSYLINLLSN